MKILALLLLLSSPLVFATKGGHGGDVIVCFDQENTAKVVRNYLRDQVNPFDQATLNKIKSIRLLDYWEYGVPRVKYESPEEAMDDVLENIEAAFLYRDLILKNYEDLDFIDYSSLPILSDEGIVPNTPLGCVIVQIAIQRDKKVLVDQALFAKLSNQDKAGLYLHEALYKMALQKEHKDSYNVRLVNSYIASAKNESREAIFNEFKENFIYFYNLIEKSFLGEDISLAEARTTNFLLDDINLKGVTKLKKGDLINDYSNSMEYVDFTIVTPRKITVKGVVINAPVGTRMKIHSNDERIDSYRVEVPEATLINGFWIKSIKVSSDENTAIEIITSKAFSRGDFKIKKESYVTLDTSFQIREVQDEYTRSRIIVKIGTSEIGCEYPVFEDGDLLSCEPLDRADSINNYLVLRSGRWGRKQNKFIDLSKKLDFNFKDNKFYNATFDSQKGVLITTEGKEYRRKSDIEKDICYGRSIVIEGSEYKCVK